MDIIDHNLFESPNFWWFRGKNELMSLLAKKLHASETWMLADIGCGTGDLLADTRNICRCYGFDSNIDALKIAKSQSQNLASSSAEALGLKSCVFDVVIVADVLEHIENDLLALREVTRITKSSGFILLSVPAFSCMYSSHDRALEHRRRYNRADILRLVSRCGQLDMEYETYWNSTIFLPLAIVRLLKKFLHHKPKLQKSYIPEFANKLLKLMISLENKLIMSGLHLPVGLSLYLVLRKRGKVDERNVPKTKLAAN